VAELCFVLDRHGEMVFADEAAQGPDLRVMGDEGREWCVGALDEPYEAVITDLRGSGAHVADESGQCGREVMGRPVGEERDELAELPAGVDRGEQRVGAYGPDPVAGVRHGRRGRAGQLR